MLITLYETKMNVQETKLYKQGNSLQISRERESR